MNYLYIVYAQNSSDARNEADAKSNKLKNVVKVSLKEKWLIEGK